MEEMLKQFIASSSKRMEQTEDVVKSLGAHTEAALRNQSVSMKQIEWQIGQIAKVLQDRFPGSLPSYTETNPRDHVKAITTLSGKELNSPINPVTNEFVSIPQQVEDNNKDNEEPKSSQ